jgi:hypothetical protein
LARVYLKEEREREEIERGRMRVIKEKAGDFRLNGHPLPLEQDRGGGLTGRPTGGGAALAGGTMHEDEREMGQNGEESAGVLFRPAPWVEMARGGGIFGDGGLRTAAVRGDDA